MGQDAGGELVVWVDDKGNTMTNEAEKGEYVVVGTMSRIILFDGNKLHGALDFVGERWNIILWQSRVS